jgi:hypothetical protein
LVDGRMDEWMVDLIGGRIYDWMNGRMIW